MFVNIVVNALKEMLEDPTVVEALETLKNIENSLNKIEQYIIIFGIIISALLLLILVCNIIKVVSIFKRKNKNKLNKEN